MTLKEDKNKIKSGLYIVSTPIGNLRDITLRALDVLKKSNVILCEDTRVSKKLLFHYEIQTNLISNYKFNEKKNLGKIVDIINEGQIVSLISDAGTPAISDPGRLLINRCIEENISIVPIPGPSAVTASMSISNFSDKFYFHGFLSDKVNSIRKELEMFKNLKCSIVFFISAQKLNKQFEMLKEFFSEREILICREITKIHESFYRGKVSEIDNFQFKPKGEVTVIISEKNNDKVIETLNESDKKKIKKLILNKSIKDIVGIISEEKNISKSKIYNYCLQIKNEK
jgi:16S rRNA (cytidine1402-2'-O)-methyltransferase|tara:strand:- start:1027 stop:1881 length:855 start_codon:yes stop_codon:yes gene_type:complete